VPINIEYHGISPIHCLLEDMSWASDPDGRMSSKYEEKWGYGDENILSAEVLNCLSFMPRAFVVKILRLACTNAGVPSDWLDGIAGQIAIHGLSGNNYYPVDDVRDASNIKLVQPDGWMLAINTAIMLEAKGTAKGAKFNAGQLAKEYLALHTVTDAKDRKILLILPEHGSGKKFIASDTWTQVASWFPETFQRHWTELAQMSCGEASKYARSNPIEKGNTAFDWTPDAKMFLPLNQIFIWVSWQQIVQLASSEPNSCLAEMIVDAVNWHASPFDRHCAPLLPKMLISKLHNHYSCDFYNGGQGVADVIAFEEEFTKVAGLAANPWAAWHQIDESIRRALDEAKAIEMECFSAQKRRIDFYKEKLNLSRASSSMRKAIQWLSTNKAYADEPHVRHNAKTNDKVHGQKNQCDHNCLSVGIIAWR